MNKVKKSATALIGGFVLMAASTSSHALSEYQEIALVDTCKSALSNKPIKLKKTLKEYRLKMKKVALNVMCNGEDIIAFAANHGADRTASRLEGSIGKVEITDVAKLEKVNVNFEL